MGWSPRCSRRSVKRASPFRRWVPWPRRVDRPGPGPGPHAGTLAALSFQQLDRLALVSHRPASAGLGGEHRSRARAPSTDFLDYRPYQPGDDFRRVDWNVYGRLGSLQVRVTEGLERLQVLLLLDRSASMRYGRPDKLAYAAQLAGALAYVGLARSDVVHVACLGQHGADSLGPLLGRARFHELASVLDGLEPDGRIEDLGQRLAGALALLPPRARRAGRPWVAVVSDFLAGADLVSVAAGLDALRGEGAEVVALQVVSPEEEHPDLVGEVELADAETGETLDLDLTRGVVERYRQRFAAWCAELEAVCVGRGLRYVRARTDRPVEALLLDDLRRARVLR